MRIAGPARGPTVETCAGTASESWVVASGFRTLKNVTVYAEPIHVSPMSELLGEQGYFESLRKRGYEILAPGIQ